MLRRTNNVDASELGKDLDGDTVHEKCPPGWDGGHDSPPRDCDGLHGCNGGLDLVEPVLDPLVVGAVKLKLLEDSHGLFLAVSLHEMAGRLGEEHDSGSKPGCWNGLDGQREPPLERCEGALGMCGAVSYPGRAATVCQYCSLDFGRVDLHNKSHSDKLLCQTSNEASDPGMRAFRLVHRHRHAQRVDDPTGNDTTNKYHGQILGGR